MAGKGFAQGFSGEMGSVRSEAQAAMTMPSGITQGQAGYPKAYTGEVPASYGKPLGQFINGIAAYHITRARTTRPAYASSLWYA